MALEQSDLDAIGQMIEAHMVKEVKEIAPRKHWRRRICGVCIVVVVSYGVRYIEDSATLHGLIYTFEAAISGFIEWSFTQAREL